MGMTRTGDPQTGVRRRGAALEASLLEAAWEELAAVGYSRLTMEGVAARARTGKQVLYRRWGNRAELVVAALRHNTGSIVDRIPDTGELRGDVLTLLRRMARRQHDVSPEVIHGLLAEVPDMNPEFFTVMREAMTAVLRQAADRGELTLAALPARVVTLPADLLRNEIFFARAPIGEDTLLEIVDDVFLPLVRAAAGGTSSR
jgi:AcrR family transcriptional regulator